MDLAERIGPGSDSRSDRDERDRRSADVVLGDDWVAPESTVEKELSDSRARRGVYSLKCSPLTRKIITFNLVALNVLVAGVLWLASSRDTLTIQMANALQSEVELIADVFEVQLPGDVPVSLGGSDGIDVAETVAGIDLREGAHLMVFDSASFLVGEATGQMARIVTPGTQAERPTLIFNMLDGLLAWVSGLFTYFYFAEEPDLVLEDRLRRMIEAGDPAATRVESQGSAGGPTMYHAFTPIRQGDSILGTIALVSPAAEIQSALSAERERVLQVFVIATLVSIGLSLVLASTIANPISDLADAAEIGRDRNRRNKTTGRIRIPDLTARPDEIGRLSGALRGMVAALYDRIDSNEQFAADVAHEIKNPLASLRSAVGSLRMVRKEEHRTKLLDVIEHDVRRLDRLVSDISNASRLDSELVKEDEQEFNLLEMLGNITEFLGQDAGKKGVEFITDLPPRPITITGLEARLAQVFVNLITNATSFCEDGDAIRVWARRRDNRVLVVVEDTGPGIPEEALQKIFKRFYTSRPQQDFGNNSGLGLAISKQIVEAHGGVIWAENIRPTEADVTSEPLGARFVVGLPV